MIKNESIQRIKDLPVKEVLEAFDLKFIKRGSKFFACCPIHGERTPSLCVDSKRNSWHCFGCGEGGSAIDFVMKTQSLSFYEAVETIAKQTNTHISYEKISEDELNRRKEISEKRETAFNIYRYVQKFFVEAFNEDSEEAKAARDYAYSRWDKELCDNIGLGYAPKDSRRLINHLEKSGFPLNLILELGIIKQDERTGDLYAQQRQRITFPIEDSFGRIIAYIGRYFGSNKDISKYSNSPDSFLFHKGETLYGINAASKEARQSNVVILVEGTPDVVRLQYLGILETVAPLGTALTEKHLEQLRKFTNTVRFIPDSDPPGNSLYGPGINAVMKNGKMAIEKGFEVSVKEIPRTESDDDSRIKKDPDSFFSTREDYLQLDDVPFVIWYAKKRFKGADTHALQMEVVAEVAAILIQIQDELSREIYVDTLTKIFGKKSMWRDAMKRAGKKLREEAASPDDLRGFDQREIKALRDLGIIIKDGCYQTPDKDGYMIRLSNFIFRPVLSIKESDKSTRVLKIINQFGEQDVIELGASDFVSMRDFKKKLIDKGNYIWRCDEAKSLTDMQEYIFAITESANKINSVGWQQKENLYAFANGIFHDGDFIKADELGVAVCNNTKFFLPPCSKLYADNKSVFNFERMYNHSGRSIYNLYDFVKQLIDVFGDGAKISFAWILAAIFRDIVFDQLEFFPILNLFGRKGSGKTELSKTLASFFCKLKSTPTSVTNTSVPAIAYMLEHAINSVVVLDEFTNEIKDNRIDIIKGMWGGTSRAKMEDKQPIIIPVQCGVILAGQYKPEDEAIFSRCIHLQYMKTSFSEEEDLKYERLKQMAALGNTHLLMEILKLRNIFELGFSDIYTVTVRDVNARISGLGIEDRIRKNWIVPLAAFRVLEQHLELPYNYNDLFEITIQGMKAQNEQVTRNSDTADFWNFIDSMHAIGQVKEKCHYVIKTLTSFRPMGNKEEKEFISPKKIIFLNFPAIRSVLERRIVKTKNGNSVSVATLEAYLKALPQYLGRKQQRFQLTKVNGEVDEKFETSNGATIRMSVGSAPKAMCFDYDALKDALDLNLETFTFSEFDDSDPNSEAIVQGILPLD